MGLSGSDPSTTRTRFCLICSSKARSKFGSCRQVFLKSPQPFSMDGRMAKWQRKQTPPIFSEYSAILNLLSRRKREDAVILIRLFKRRKRAKLTNGFLATCWECSVSTAKRRLDQLQAARLIGRITGKAKQQTDGSWTRQRLLILLKPSDIRVHFSPQLNPSGGASAPELNPNGQGTANEKFSLEKQALMLSRRISISRRWWCFLLRQMGVQRISGFPMRLYDQVKDRTDLIEGVLWTMVETSPPPYRPAGFFLAEVRART